MGVTTGLGLEYFCFAGDDLWSRSDDELIELGKRELAVLGLVRADRVRDGTLVRMEKAYAVYDPDYQDNVDIIRRALAPLSNLQVVGRPGMHKYNNQDRSIMTRAARGEEPPGRSVQPLELQHRRE